MLRLEIRHPQGQKDTIAVAMEPTGSISIGRKADNDVVLADEWTSRHHARIQWAGGELEIEDLESANGVFLNGQRIRGRTKFAPGDVIIVGRTEIELKTDAPADPFDTSDLTD